MSNSSKPVVTRFAPSPTGYLHIGGARTALYNWLFSRHHGGQFHLRIEDTDRQRSTQDAMDAIIEGMNWMELDWDGDIVFQSERAERHREVANQMLADGKAYKCYATAEELQDMREKSRAEGRPLGYDGRWRDASEDSAPVGVPHVVRIKSPREGEVVICDMVQGDVRVANEQLDDMILLRSDGTPTYMLSVVVDDHDMGVTHVIRGDDHLTNAFRQHHIYKAMNWDVPEYGHIPLIHGADGAKLSKRHGALGVDAYRDMGYLPHALRNYLTRLGWGHGDLEIFSTDEAVKLFTMAGVGKGPSRFDFKKLENLNGHYIREANDADLSEIITPLIEGKLSKSLSSAQKDILLAALPALKERAKTIPELVESSLFYFFDRPIIVEDDAMKLLEGEVPAMLGTLIDALSGVTTWDEETLTAAVRDYAEAHDLKLGKVAQPLRSALTGRKVSPSVFGVMTVLGREESLARLSDQTG